MPNEPIPDAKAQGFGGLAYIGIIIGILLAILKAFVWSKGVFTSPVAPPQAPRTEELPGHAGLDSREAELRCRKLELEIEVLRRQGTPRLIWLDVAKAITGPVAFLGLIVTIFTVTAQLRQAQRARDDDRFDRAIARLGSPSAAERLVGVVGLQIFLRPNDRDRHPTVLQFLSNALVTEKDSTVRKSILDTFGRLTPGEVDQTTLNTTLETLRDTNRRLFDLYSRAEPVEDLRPKRIFRLCEPRARRLLC